MVLPPKNFEINCIDTFPEELADCKVGEYVNVWSKRDLDFVNVYRKGTGGGCRP